MPAAVAGASEEYEVEPDSTEFDPAQYGMAAEYDEQGNYKYPEGFDPETNEWIEGFEEQRAAWEQQYAEAQGRWEAHKEQVRRHLNEDAEAAVAGAGVATSSSSSSSSSSPASSAPSSYSSDAPAEDGGTLASDEALAALREKLTGN